MNRHAFLAQLAGLQPASLEPHAAPLDLRRAYHLLRRATFGVTLPAARQLVGKRATEAVDLLLDNALRQPQPAPPAWAAEPMINPDRLPLSPEERIKAAGALFEQAYRQNYELRDWWMDRLQQDTLSLREKMTLFWHGHFATKFAIADLMPAQLMYRQNQLFRQQHQGDFKALVEAVTLDGAMLIFLSGQFSTREAPNENYSRELLELYTTGLGHYTEKDVQEGARILTGWRISYFKDEHGPNGPFASFFLPREHDTGAKVYLGVAFPPTSDNAEAAVRQAEVRRMIGVIFEQRSEAVAQFVCHKLYRYFVHGNPGPAGQAVVQELAALFRQANFQLRPVLRALLSSAHFFNDDIIGTQPKSPADYVIGQSIHFGVEAGWRRWVMDTMGQELLNPPDVSGWPGYRRWINTRTFPFAVQQASGFVWSQKDEQLLAWAKQFPDYDDADKFVAGVGQLLLARPLTPARLERYRKAMLGLAPAYEWYSMLQSAGTAAPRIRNLLLALAKAPDFHLC